MLTITIPEGELYDELSQEFITSKTTTLCLEHSLVSISKWEAKWNKPFLAKEDKTVEETLDYIRCMTLTQNVNPNVYLFLDSKLISLISNYIDAPMTATWFSENSNKKGPPNQKAVTSELIYYWMIALNIPFECQKWHLNRLITLIQVCNEENKPKKNLGRGAAARRTAAINAARRKQHKKR